MKKLIGVISTEFNPDIKVYYDYDLGIFSFILFNEEISITQFRRICGHIKYIMYQFDELLIKVKRENLLNSLLE